MTKKVTAVFDIGKTNKKILLFDPSLKLLWQKEVEFEEIKDDDGFEGEDIERLVNWIKTSLENLVTGEEYDVETVNFSTYGATLVFLDEKGNRVTPVYNYLKPMPEGLLGDFYRYYGGKEEFSRKTASPVLGMLNSGLQIYWLKKTKPKVFEKVKHILHLPQYLSYLFTGKIISEYTSIGCHTALWDFDKMKYHQWLRDEDILLPAPVPNETLFEAEIKGKKVKMGTGIHDSSASLVPYLKLLGARNFILSSTGTWAINMNPFNREPLTSEQLVKDCLCYMSIDREQVKSSRLFLGHIHDLNVKTIAEYFNEDKSIYKNVKTDRKLLSSILRMDNIVLFPNGIPADYSIDTSELKQFSDFRTAYHQLMFELSAFEAGALDLVNDQDDSVKDIYIIGGFANNDIFCTLLATFFSDKKVYTAELYNATALGAAMVVSADSDPFNLELNLEQKAPL
ncbi:MAG TPA: FGGY family carbohydrate kinase [Bacteroidales bacterium]|nr:FGGY family carbohydrate kinase [Bacteroidales bacterium]